MICPKHKTIFFHAVKTGGTSIEAAFGFDGIKPEHGKHANVEEIKNHLCNDVKKPWMYEDFFKFTFVRNPFGVVYSFYCYHSAMVDAESHLVDLFKMGPKYGNTFEDFVIGLTEIDKLHARALRGFARTQQKQFAYIGDEINVDFLGRFENLEKDFQVVARATGLNPGGKMRLPHKNNSGKTTPYWHYYTYETREIVEKLFKEDLETFNYCF